MFLLLDKEMMGSSGEMATTEQIKGEQVGCSNTVVMEKLSADQVSSLSLHMLAELRMCVQAHCFLPRQAAVSPGLVYTVQSLVFGVLWPASSRLVLW